MSFRYSEVITLKNNIFLYLLFASYSNTGKAPSDTAREAIPGTFEVRNQGWTNDDTDLAVLDYAEDTDWTNAFDDRFIGRAVLRMGYSFNGL